MSIDITGRVYLFETSNDDFNSLVSKKLEYNLNYFDDMSKATLLSENQFAICSKPRNIELYRITSSQMEQYSSINTKTDSEVTYLNANTNSKTQNQLIIMSNTDGSINMFDTRMEYPAIKYRIGLTNGIISCLTFSTND